MTPSSLGTYLTFVAAVLATFGPVAYAVLPNTRKTWYRDDVGRHLMVYMTSFALVIDLIVVAVLTHSNRQDDWFAWIRTIVFVLVPISLGWRDWIVIRQYLRNKKEENDEESTSMAD